MLPVPAPVVRAYPGDKLWCLAIGSGPVYTTLIRNSTVLANATSTVEIGSLKEGNYSCMVTNKFGTDTRVIPIIILGNLLLSKSRISLAHFSLLLHNLQLIRDN